MGDQLKWENLDPSWIAERICYPTSLSLYGSEDSYPEVLGVLLFDEGTHRNLTNGNPVRESLTSQDVTPEVRCTSLDTATRPGVGVDSRDVTDTVDHSVGRQVGSVY